jgi:hypothetical protein
METLNVEGSEEDNTEREYNAEVRKDEDLNIRRENEIEDVFQEKSTDERNYC